MKQNYFVYNGKKYGTGTIFRIKELEKIYPYKRVEQSAVFISYDPETDRYMFQVGDSKNNSPGEFFWRDFVCVTEDVNVDIKQKYQANEIKANNHTFMDELNIDGMLIAWMWYIFIIAVAVIFNERIGIWIFASIVFFRYRNKKLKERGYK